MASIFQIVPSTEILQLDGDGQGEVSITVTNLAKSTAARALIVPIEEEREYLAGIPEEVKIVVAVPEEAPEGEHKFRVDVVSEENPDDDFSEGPEIVIMFQA